MHRQGKRRSNRHARDVRALLFERGFFLLRRMIRLIRKQRLDRVYRSAFECSKVLVCTYPLRLLNIGNSTAYALNPCIHAGFTHFRLIESLLSARFSTFLFPTKAGDGTRNVSAIQQLQHADVSRRSLGLRNHSFFTMISIFSFETVLHTSEPAPARTLSSISPFLKTFGARLLGCRRRALWRFGAVGRQTGSWKSQFLTQLPYSP
jgi:hypothetical protein